MSNNQSTFIDLFAGCGGLSLGLLKSGWKGLFAIEQNPDAFKTLKYNLIDENEHNMGRPKFCWPDWLDKYPYEISEFINKKSPHLAMLNRKLDLVAGGPPCQGFSFAGARSDKDPRNELFRDYLKIVEITEPRFVLMENVKGIDIAFGSIKNQNSNAKNRITKSYAKLIQDHLREIGYYIQDIVLNSVEFGVPQTRSRHFTFGIRLDCISNATIPDIKARLLSLKKSFLLRKGLPLNAAVTVSEAISDLVTCNKRIVSCTDRESPSGFSEIVYENPMTNYQKLMHDGLNGQTPNSMRLVKHKVITVARFKKILETCRKGVQLSRQDRERLRLKKQAITPLAPDLPSPTLTTLPDDLLHYSEPRINTVREQARLQSFPDWFEFKGKFTTGGDKRVKECPRYTQVGNAVPPLLAEAIGETLLNILSEAQMTCPIDSHEIKYQQRKIIDSGGCNEH